MHLLCLEIVKGAIRPLRGIWVNRLHALTSLLSWLSSPSSRKLSLQALSLLCGHIALALLRQPRSLIGEYCVTARLTCGALGCDTISLPASRVTTHICRPPPPLRNAWDWAAAWRGLRHQRRRCDPADDRQMEEIYRAPDSLEKRERLSKITRFLACTAL